MYTRELQPPRATPIEKGKPLTGTWTGPFAGVDLLDIRRPYSIPLPRWLRDWRVKEWESFLIQDDHFYLDALFCNLKLFRMVRICLYDKEAGELFRFRKVIPFMGWRLPPQLSNASINHRARGFFFRIHNWLAADRIELDLDIAASRRRPSFTAHLEYSLNPRHNASLAVTMPVAGDRCVYTFKAMAEVRGDMVLGGRHIVFDPAGTGGIACDVKGFFPYFMHSSRCTSLGFDEGGRRYGFSLGEHQTRETFKHNENALWTGALITPLPPVRITQPEGPELEWIIQDTEGMVDLSFTPVLPLKSCTNLVLVNMEYFAALGNFNGFLLNSEGERMQVRNLWGLAEKLYVRV